MTEYETRLQSALSLLAPRADDTAAWQDVVKRSAIRSHTRWRVAALALALLTTSGLVAGAFAQGLVHRGLDRLGAWAGEQPGSPDPERQAAFERANAAAYAQFPTGTRVGRLLRADVDSRSYDLMGFRAGTNLCLRVVPSPVPPHPSTPECVPQAELVRLGEPLAAVSGHIRTRLPDGSGLTMVYGLASDAIRSVELLEGGRPRGHAALENNAFLYATADRPGSPVEGPELTLRALDAEGAISEVPVVTTRWSPFVDPVGLPGPDRVERRLSEGSIGWIERGEARGEAFPWPEGYPQRIVNSRLIQPDASSAFRLGLAYAVGTGQNTRGGWYCLAWLWPLLKDSFASYCGRAEAVGEGLSYVGAWHSSGVQFPLWVGMASDDVARLELFHPDGQSRPVALLDNVFTFQTSRRDPVKLVAYDHEGRVVKMEVVGGRGSSLRAASIGR